MIRGHDKIFKHLFEILEYFHTTQDLRSKDVDRKEAFCLLFVLLIMCNSWFNERVQKRQVSHSISASFGESHKSRTENTLGLAS